MICNLPMFCQKYFIFHFWPQNDFEHVKMTSNDLKHWSKCRFRIFDIISSRMIWNLPMFCQKYFIFHFWPKNDLKRVIMTWNDLEHWSKCRFRIFDIICSRLICNSPIFCQKYFIFHFWPRNDLKHVILTPAAPCSTTSWGPSWSASNSLQNPTFGSSGNSRRRNFIKNSRDSRADQKKFYSPLKA